MQCKTCGHTHELHPNGDEASDEVGLEEEEANNDEATNEEDYKAEKAEEAKEADQQV
jgi:hypothetical protein